LLGRRAFAIYRTPADTWQLIPEIATTVRTEGLHVDLTAAWEVLRAKDPLTKATLLELCPRLPRDVVDNLHPEGDQEVTPIMLAAVEFLCCPASEEASERGEATIEKLNLFFTNLLIVEEGTSVSVATLEKGIGMLFQLKHTDAEDGAQDSTLVPILTVAKIVAEALGPEAENGEAVQLIQLLEWARSGSTVIADLERLLPTPEVLADNPPESTWTIAPVVDFEKIKVSEPIVELDGDEMARIMWQMIKEKLIFPFLDMDIDYYDLSITYRDETEDQVVREAVKAIKKHTVAVKCPTILPDQARVLEFNLRKQWPSAGLALRESFAGTLFSMPIVIPRIPRAIPGWNEPIVVAKCSQSELLPAAQHTFEQPGALKIVFNPEAGDEDDSVEIPVPPLASPGALMITSISKDAVERFAKACFEFALISHLPLYISSMSPVLDQYDGLLVSVFHSLYQEKYKKIFEERGLYYQHVPMDDMVAKAVQSSGGFVWACKRHDADVQSALVSQGFGGPWMMTSVTTCPAGRTVLVEASHGTVTKHFRVRSRREETFTNPLACLFTWSRGLAHRARLSENQELALFCKLLEEAALTTVERGNMSKDLAALMYGDREAEEKSLTTEDILDAVATELRRLISRGPLAVRAPQQEGEQPARLSPPSTDAP